MVLTTEKVILSASGGDVGVNWGIPAESVGGYGEVYVLETPEGQKCFVAPEA